MPHRWDVSPGPAVGIRPPMSFIMDLTRPLADEVRRVAREQTESAVALLQDQTGDELDAAVHGARKRCKRVRALVRLVRAPLGGGYAAENAAYRDAARLLGDVRDAAVLVATLDAVGEEHDLELADVRSALCVRHADRRTALQADGRREEAAGILVRAGRRIDDWTLDDEGWQLVAPGFQKVARRVRRRHRRALATVPGGAADHAFHDWRKRVKYHWHHLELLAELWPPVMTVLADETHRLSDLLGDEHDLTVLRDVVLDEGLLADDGRRDLFLAVVDGRRQRLRRGTGRLADRLTADRPAVLTRRFGRWFAAAARV